MPSLVRQLSPTASVMLKAPSSAIKASTAPPLSLSEDQTRAIWRTADCVCFDVDSTVCVDEAIDELARFADREQEVADLTAQAMKGGMTFREALDKRLELIKPTVSMVQSYIREHPPQLSPGVRDLVAQLHTRGTAVYLVSGGFKSIIEAVADELSIPYDNIFANQIKFYYDGTYAGFEENQPTSYQDGKARVVRRLKEQFGYQRVVMVGDGVTDLAACPPADAFVGYGGNQIRDQVRTEAPWFVRSFSTLFDELRK